jgi:hypothetical protein
VRIARFPSWIGIEGFHIREQRFIDEQSERIGGNEDPKGFKENHIYHKKMEKLFP